MNIAETFTVAAPIERVWAFITDPAQVAPCVPGCEQVEVLGPRSYRARVKVAVGPIKTAFNVTVELTTEEMPTFLASTTRGEEGSKASMVTAQNQLRLVATGPDTTEVSYASEVSLVGRLGKFGLGMMKKKAKTLGEEFAVAFRARVEAGQAPSGTSTPPGGHGEVRVEVPPTENG